MRAELIDGTTGAATWTTALDWRIDSVRIAQADLAAGLAEQVGGDTSGYRSALLAPRELNAAAWNLVESARILDVQPSGIRDAVWLQMQSLVDSALALDETLHLQLNRTAHRTAI